VLDSGQPDRRGSVGGGQPDRRGSVGGGQLDRRVSVGGGHPDRRGSVGTRIAMDFRSRDGLRGQLDVGGISLGNFIGCEDGRGDFSGWSGVVGDFIGCENGRGDRSCCGFWNFKRTMVSF
jgi:hypothetical protein